MSCFSPQTGIFPEKVVVVRTESDVPNLSCLEEMGMLSQGILES